MTTSPASGAAAALHANALALYQPPFKYADGYIWDASGNMVADSPGVAEGAPAARIRGWGRIGYMENAAVLQDAAGELIAQALTEFWNRRATSGDAAKHATEIWEYLVGEGGHDRWPSPEARAWLRSVAGEQPKETSK